MQLDQTYVIKAVNENFEHIKMDAHVCSMQIASSQLNCIF